MDNVNGDGELRNEITFAILLFWSGDSPPAKLVMFDSTPMPRGNEPELLVIILLSTIFRKRRSSNAPGNSSSVDADRSPAEFTAVMCCTTDIYYSHRHGGLSVPA